MRKKSCLVPLGFALYNAKSTESFICKIRHQRVLGQIDDTGGKIYEKNMIALVMLS